MTNRQYRPLVGPEIETLIANGCMSAQWSDVLVSDPFVPERISATVFEGRVRLGRQDGSVRCRDGVERPSTIFRALLRDVTVGENCRIANVGIALEGLQIGSHVEIEHVGRIASTPDATFGNGHMVSSLNEGGGRGVRILTNTSAQAAYLWTFYRHDSRIAGALEAMCARRVAELKGKPSRIGAGAFISNCGEIVDVWIGERATVSGAQLLRDGTIESSAQNPTLVGSGVIAEHFVIQRGAVVVDGAMVRSSLVGEAAQVGKQASVENSLLFANAECFHSELCSVYAGPYSVTHHRSTLLIAAYTSFYNAGSGTNQSNHMYKLGPVHQGILERGCKTGSSAYLLWPARIGAFSVVIGKHYANVDTSDLPFSYVNEEAGRTVVVPAMNLFTVGTMRDGAKWPSRDRRGGADSLDQIIFNVLSPYTAGKMAAGRALLLSLHEQSEKGAEFVQVRGAHIKRLLLKTCARYYSLGLDKYVGDVIAARCARRPGERLRAILAPASTGAAGDQPWVDLCGLLCAKSRADALVEQIASGRVLSLDALNEECRTIREQYDDDEWEWVRAYHSRVCGTELHRLSDENLRALIDTWAASSGKILRMVLQDAQKEFEGGARVGYGIDGAGEADFAAVRGDFETNPFVMQVRRQIDSAMATAERLKGLI